MGNLIHMDLYRMRKSRAFWVCLILALVLPIARPGVENLLIMVARMLSDEVPAVSDAVSLSGLISNALPIVNGMLCMISLSIFFYADIEFGYVKNIAGQMPKKALTRLRESGRYLPEILLLAVLFVLSTSALVSQSYNPFIYFRF